MSIPNLYVWLAKESKREVEPLTLPQAIVAAYFSLYHASLDQTKSRQLNIEFCEWIPGQHPGTRVPLFDLSSQDIPISFADETKMVDWVLLPSSLLESEPIRWVQTLSGKTHYELLASRFQAQRVNVTFHHIRRFVEADAIIVWFLRLLCDDVEVTFSFPSSGRLADLGTQSLPATEQYLRHVRPAEVQLALDWPGPPSVLKAACTSTKHVNLTACIDTPRSFEDVLTNAVRLNSIDIHCRACDALIQVLRSLPATPLACLSVFVACHTALPLGHLLGDNTTLSVHETLAMEEDFHLGKLHLVAHGDLQLAADIHFHITELVHATYVTYDPVVAACQRANPNMERLLACTDVLTIAAQSNIPRLVEGKLSDCYPNLACVRMTDGRNCYNPYSHRGYLSALKAVFPNAILDYQVQAYGRVLLGLAVYGPGHVMSDRHLGKLQLPRQGRCQQLHLAVALDVLHAETEQVATAVFNRILQWAALDAATTLQPGLNGYLLSMDEYRALAVHLGCIPARGMTPKQREEARSVFVARSRERKSLKRQGSSPTVVPLSDSPVNI
jgi:hypothetical protein